MVVVGWGPAKIAYSGRRDAMIDAVNVLIAAILLVSVLYVALRRWRFVRRGIVPKVRVRAVGRNPNAINAQPTSSG